MNSGGKKLEKITQSTGLNSGGTEAASWDGQESPTMVGAGPAGEEGGRRRGTEQGFRSACLKACDSLWILLNAALMGKSGLRPQI
jgi:hypothetical protein